MGRAEEMGHALGQMAVDIDEVAQVVPQSGAALAAGSGEGSSDATTLEGLPALTTQLTLSRAASTEVERGDFAQIMQEGAASSMELEKSPLDEGDEEEEGSAEGGESEAGDGLGGGRRYMDGMGDVGAKALTLLTKTRRSLQLLEVRGRYSE